MLDGVEQGMTPPAPIDEDIYEWDEAKFTANNVKTLPQTLGEALVALKADSTLAQAIGLDFVKEYINIKTPEWI
jgi:glutamine synthetase